MFNKKELSLLRNEIEKLTKKVSYLINTTTNMSIEIYYFKNPSKFKIR